MKKLSKVLVLVLSAIMVLAMSASVFAQTVGTAAADKGSITISNAAKGETYTIYKLFDASVTGNDGGSVRYTGTVPEGLADYFKADSAGNIQHGKMVNGEFVPDATAVTDLTADEIAAITAWAETATETAHAVSDGSALTFAGLDYGYYVVHTTQGDSAISVNTTNPDVSVIDKNTTVPVTGLTKTVDGEDEVVSIGDTVTYTVSFSTANYDGEDQITKYVIEDTLPAFLNNVNVTSIIVDDDGSADTTNDQHDVTAQFSSKKIELAWTEGTTSKYKNGAKVTVVYTAVVTEEIVAGNVDTNANTVTITPYAGDKEVTVEDNEVTETIKTYAAALQKIDENGANLAGATFQVPGLTVTGSAGNYTVVSFDPTSTAAGTTMACDDNGLLVIRGISNEADLSVTEVDAPDGYNKLTAPATVTPVVTSTMTTAESSTTTTTIYYDADGNVVDTEIEGGSSSEVTTTTVETNIPAASIVKIENQKGAVLPGTGGIGTTIFYVLGSLLVVGCGIVLISRKRMQNNK